MFDMSRFEKGVLLWGTNLGITPSYTSTMESQMNFGSPAHPLNKIEKTKTDLLQQIEEGLQHISNEQLKLESEILEATRIIATAETMIESGAEEAKRLQLLRDALGDNNGDQQAHTR
jgi:hypothetical protein